MTCARSSPKSSGIYAPPRPAARRGPRRTPILPHRDALSAVSCGGSIPVPVGRRGPRAQGVWVDRDADVCCRAGPGLPVCLETGSAGMAVTGPPERGPSTTLGAGTIVSRAGSPTEATEADLRALESNILTTTVGRVVSWARKNSLWPAQFGLACCAIEMIATAQARFDIARFGSEAFRASPRQADLMIVSGRVSQKMAPVVKHIYEQMLEPKWVIAMGDCASCGGVFNNYALVQGVDKLIPVDVYVAGCPPRPEALLYGFLKLQELIAEPAHRRRR